MIPAIPAICKCVVLLATGITGVIISASQSKGDNNATSNR